MLSAMRWENLAKKSSSIQYASAGKRDEELGKEKARPAGRMSEREGSS